MTTLPITNIAELLYVTNV